MLEQYSRGQRKQIEQYFRCLSYICTDGMISYYYLAFDFQKKDRFIRNHYMKKILKRWHITDITSLKKELSWLLEDQHREHYLRLHKQLTALPWEARQRYVKGFENEADYRKLAVVNRMIPELPSGDISAFSTAWMILLCQIGEAHDLLSKEEAWKLKLKAAEYAHQAYSSWPEYIIGFTAGSYFMLNDGKFQKNGFLARQAVTISNGKNPLIKRFPWGMNLYPDNGKFASTEQSVATSTYV
ncbi:DUF1266 domain-containing protein [Paenibacillus dakarensis]|uniref:DUF1266 domain-containing protein n=1 Tax=Paenibacillus dakarensis TaxID=1527293 RepID=UPI0006D53F82|nr:DUF1266 domain-containing protein [Paenibacillus dakarensis]